MFHAKSAKVFAKSAKLFLYYQYFAPFAFSFVSLREKKLSYFTIFL